MLLVYHLKADFINPTIQNDTNASQLKAIVKPSYLPFAYQWFDCTLEQNIMGATDSIFNTQNIVGSVGLEISYRGCNLSSLDCPVITVTKEINVPKNSLLFYPNPANSWIYTQEMVRIFNSNGQLVLIGKEYLDINHLTPGIY